MNIKINSGLTKNFTKVPNEILKESQLSVPARMLYITLLRYCGSRDYCYPSQETLSMHLGVTARMVRNYIEELCNSGIVSKTRRGFNKPNTYQVSKNLHRNTDKKLNSCHIGPMFPLQGTSLLPTNKTYIKRTENISEDNFALKKKQLINNFSVKK